MAPQTNSAYIDGFLKRYDGGRVLKALEKLAADSPSGTLFDARAIAHQANGGNSKPADEEVSIPPEAVPFILARYADRVSVCQMMTHPSTNHADSLIAVPLYSLNR